LRIVVAIRPRGLELLDTASLDLTTILWTAAVAVGTGLLFGIGPVIFAWQQSLDGALRTGGGARGESTRARTHAALVVGQIALSLIFLAAAGVVARSFVGLVLTPVGYQPEGLFEVSARRTAASEPVPVHHSTPAEQAAIAMALRKTLGTMPEVSEVAVGMLPLSNAGPGPTAVTDSAGVRPISIELTGLTYVSPEYFHVTQIPLVQGRGFDADPAVAAGEIVINETLARRLWPDRDAVGSRLRDWEGEWLTVVGVAGDIQMPGSLAEYYRLQMYRAGTMSGPITWLVLRTRDDLSTLRPRLAHAVEHAGVGVIFRDVVAAESTLEYAFAAPRFALVLFGTFALVAVALAAMGLFGNVAFAVARRTREIGVRVALGASPDTVGRLILGNGLRLTVVGCGLGLLGSYAAVRTLAAFLYDMKPPDLAIFGGTMLVLVVVALVASFIPMRRALRIDPMDVLRAD
jgi:putative ABC transport system permease protein